MYNKTLQVTKLDYGFNQIVFSEDLIVYLVADRCKAGFKAHCGTHIWRVQKSHSSAVVNRRMVSVSFIFEEGLMKYFASAK